MPTTVKTGWLKDKNGDKFAPKTLTSQVQTNDGILIEDSMSAIASGAADDALLEANQYTDGKIALLMNNSSAAVDSIMELATAMKENDEVVGALEEAIGKKANSSDLTDHTTNPTVHITSDERTKWNEAKAHADSDHAPRDAEKNVQSDWSVTDSNSDAFIKNKPTIPTTASDVGAVPTTRKVNNKVLSADISLTASDVGAATTNDITNAINALDSTVSAESGKYISAITQTNGKITATKASLPSLSGGTAATNDATVVGGVTVNGHTVTVGKKTLKAGSNISITGGTNEITISSVEQKSVFYVTLTMEMGWYSSDATYAQIKAAYDAGNGICCNVIGTDDDGSSYGDFCLPLTRLGDNSFIFIGVFDTFDADPIVKGIKVTIDSASNNVEFYTIYSPESVRAIANGAATSVADDLLEAIAQKSQVKMKIWTESDMGGA